MKDIYKILNDFKLDKKFWNHNNLSSDDYDFSRSKPGPYLKKTIEIAQFLNLKTLVEIGSTRTSVTKKCIDYFEGYTDPFLSPPCCGDGHSTFFWADAGFEVHTVDVDENCIDRVNWCYSNLEIEKPKNLHIHIPKDGIEFLNEFSKNIDILFLDGWDKGTPNYAEKHLECYEIARKKLSETHLILIDDTDYNTTDGGKDKLLTPKLIDDGYIPLFNGRQTLFYKSSSNYSVFDKQTIVSDENTKIDNSLKKENSKNMQHNNKTTLVTGLWNIGRSDLTIGWSRGYEHYLNKFEQLLKSDYNLIIFGDSELEKFVSSRRNTENTQFVIRELSWFKNNEFYDVIQNIRLNPSWYNQVGWLTDSTQAKLDMYNPLVMSKVFLLHDAKILDKFNSEYLYWIDAGLTNTVHSGYFTHDNVIEKLGEHNFITFVSFPYKAETEIHGFNYEEMCSIVGEKIDKVCRGGFFGGPKNLISEFNSQYYSLMRETLSSGFMGTEESLFTILLYKYCETYQYFEIESNGLLSKFFEDVKNGNHKLLSQCSKTIKTKNETNVGLYVIGFNSPKQFETLIESMIQYDCNFIDKPQKFLLNNSTDESTFDKYEELCAKYEFVHIKKDNLGICGGRQFIAEHAETNNIDYYFFFEDDMFFYPKKGEVCRNGFNRFVDNFYNSILQIIQNHNFDFIKFNYSEFFGDNGVQWSWYNVPQVVREQFWPNNTRLPKHGLDQNAPRTNYENIRSHNGIPYVTGEVYYSNWPQVVSKDGNKKMFLNTTWAHPYEQTWMSHIFQETKAGNIKPALLLITPTEHNRFEHYAGNLRKES
jgi:hypothetical protein